MTNKSTPRKTAASVAIDPAMVRELADIISETGLTEIEVEHGSLRVRVSRQPAATAVTQYAAPAPAAPAPAPAPVPASGAASAPASGVGAAAAPGEAPAGGVPSPMVGTAYLSPDPDSPPFITVGQSVKEGDTLLLIEAMKTFNPIPAPRAGTITQILVGDSDPVEFGQSLVVLG